jgi:hypothetical protein
VPTARLSTGKTVAPLRPPRMHTLRGVQIRPTSFHPFPVSEELVLDEGVSIEAARVVLGDRLSYELPTSDLYAPPVESLPAALEPTWLAAEPLLPPGTGPAMGSRFPASPPASGDGGLIEPAAEGGGAANLWELTFPLLEREGWEVEAGLEGEPRLRAYQVESAQALVAQEALLLADDPGTGKTAAACVALRALYQRGWARRSLVVCLEHELRHWSRHLARWAPALRVLSIRGDRMQRAQRWSQRAHVYLIGHEALADDILHGTLDPEDLAFDIAVMDDALLLADFPEPVRTAFDRLRARRRWALAGSRPEDPEEWEAIFTFVLGNRTQVRRALAAGELAKAFEPNLLRRTRAQLEAQLPAHSVSQAWIALTREDASAYDESLAEERHRLSQLGDGATQDDLTASYQRLADSAALGRAGRLGAKAQAVVDLLADVTAAGHKAIVVTRPEGRGQERLRTALDPFGVVVLSSLRDEAELREDIETFLQRPSWHVLLADLETLERAGPLRGIAYLIHFASDWNPARCRQSESWLLERSGAGASLNVYEFLTLGTVEERLHRLLAERGWPSDALPEGASPQDVAGALTLKDWMEGVFEVEVVVRQERVPAPRPAISTGMLPGTDSLRTNLMDLPPAGLLDGVAQWVRALGFDEVETTRAADEAGGDLTARRTVEGKTECVLVRCVRSEKNVGVAEAKALLQALEPRTDWLGGYLVTTSDFTSACKKAADQSSGRLGLVSGAELWRHLHIQGLV